MILIVASTEDTAGINIAQKIIEQYTFEKLSDTFQKNPVYTKRIQNKDARLLFVNAEITETQFITDFFTPQLLIFLSKHKSISGIPTLSIHTPGNIADAKLGGIPRRVSISPASAMKVALFKMAQLREETEISYDVSYECTHHGPSLNVPAMFAELGSSPKQWNDLRAAEIVAHAVMAAASRSSSYPAALGIGGPHYNPKFTRIALETSIAFGHIIPKHVIHLVDTETIKQCLERTAENVDSIILDWKGIRSSDKDRLMTTLSEMKVPVEKV